MVGRSACSALVLVEFVVPNTARAPADRGMGSGGAGNGAVSGSPSSLAWMEVDSMSWVSTH